MPLMVATSWFGICSSTSAFCTAASTPKSPQPGHQVWIDLALKVRHGGQFWSRYISRHRLSLLDHDLVRGNGKGRASRSAVL